MEIEKYHIVQRVIHWVMALLIIILLVMGYVMQDLSQENKYFIYGLHKSFGVLVLVMVAVRVYFRLKYKVPVLPREIPKYARVISGLNHKLFYVLMILMPLSGYMMSNAKGYAVKFFNLVELPFIVNKNKVVGDLSSQLHGVIAVVFIVVIVLHLIGVIKHSIEDKKFIKRMI